MIGFNHEVDLALDLNAMSVSNLFAGSRARRYLVWVTLGFALPEWLLALHAWSGRDLSAARALYFLLLALVIGATVAALSWLTTVRLLKWRATRTADRSE